MDPLSPSQAANLAQAVYGIRETDKISSLAEGVSQRMRGVDNSMDQLWDLGSGQIIESTSGGLGRTQDSGFAMVLTGQGQMKGQKAVAIRGTQTKPDWLSNFNIASTSGPNGTSVHAGFMKIYSIMREELTKALRGHTGPIHISGHSLGGALSSLLAADLCNGSGTKPFLYTFGAPRVGTLAFASSIDRALAGRQFRVYDLADPVPMIPVFPYLHAPVDGRGIRVGSSAALINPDNHSMRDNYIPQVRKLDWGALESGSDQIRNFRKVDELLEIAGIHVSIPGGSLGLRALGRALQAIVDVAFLLVSGVVLITDKIANLILKAAELSQQLASAVLRFMSLAFRWAGKKIVSGVELTASFLKYALSILLKPIQEAGRKALDKIRGT